MVNYFSGSVGDAISVMVPDVYISDDGGYSWAKMLEGPHYYTILDSGGIIVAIEHSNRPINVIKYACSKLPTQYLHRRQWWGSSRAYCRESPTPTLIYMVRFCRPLAKAPSQGFCEEASQIAQHHFPSHSSQL